MTILNFMVQLDCYKMLCEGNLAEIFKSEICPKHIKTRQVLGFLLFEMIDSFSKLKFFELNFKKTFLGASKHKRIVLLKQII